KDPATGVDLAEKMVYGLKGKDYFRKMELYNTTLRNTCGKLALPVVELALKLPKDTKLYIDDMHYSDLGCQMVADIIEKDLMNIVSLSK
ncbi:MAG: hypothetical protein ACRCVT_16435, partial [Leadbetterella sp.]